MKAGNMFIVSILVLSLLVFSGCSSDSSNQFPNQEQNMQRDADTALIRNQQDVQQRANESVPQNDRRLMNPSGDRQPPGSGSNGQMNDNMREQFEEMQQQAVDACKDKDEGDSCQSQSPMGEMEGKCTLRDEQLICIGEMPDRPMR